MKQIAAVLAICVTAGVAYADPQTVVDDSRTPQYLFTLAATSGIFAAGTLTLNGVPLVVYFTDRPHRIAGHMDLETFLEKWEQGVDNFNVNPPNAELAIYEEDGDLHAVLIIRKPAVADDSIAFEVELIDEEIPASFGHATLFIDDMPDPEFGLRPGR